jgi:hypothetical protein
MNNAKVTMRFKDEFGNIIKATEAPDKSVGEVMGDFTGAAVIIAIVSGFILKSGFLS